MRTVHTRKGVWAAFGLMAAVLASSLLFVSVVIAAPAGSGGGAAGVASATVHDVASTTGHGMPAYPGGRPLVARGHAPLNQRTPIPAGYAGLAGIVGAVVIMGTFAIWARGQRNRMVTGGVVTELGPREQERRRRAA